MPHFHIPHPVSQQYLEGLVHGFYLEITEQDEVALLIKPEPSILDSIMAGCPLEIYLVNPNIQQKTIILYIHDSSSTPYHMLHHHFGIEDKVVRGFDAIAIKIAHSKKIKLALYNAASSCVYTCYLATNANTSNFDEWLFHVFNTEAYRYPTNLSVLHNTPGSSTNGFSVHLQNRNHRNEEKISIISLAIPDDPSNNYPPIEHAFNYDQFLGDGKHGYHQELGITVTLERFFKRGTELFVSPKYIDGLEFSDYLLLNKNAVIVIESKYVISSKSTKRHQAIKKAIHQLNRAEQSILAGEAGLKDKVIKSALKGTTVVLKVCLLNSAIQLNDDNARNIADSFSKCELPIFISVAGFFNLLTGLVAKKCADRFRQPFFQLDPLVPIVSGKRRSHLLLRQILNRRII